MVLQFKVIEDQSLWAIDLDKLQYVCLSRALADVFENPSQEPVVEEFGKLVQVNQLLRVFRMEGRTPSTEGPGAGLTSVIVVLDVIDTALIITLNANVKITEPICVKPILSVKCEVLGQEAIH